MMKKSAALMAFLMTAAGALGSDCGQSALSIEQIQGVGETSPYEGQAVTVEAIVTAVFNGREEMDGFFIQEEDRNSQASHGLFVYSDLAVSAGEQLRLRGKVKEFYGLTELTNVRLLERCSVGPSPQPVFLPGALSPEQREALEGVLVQTPLSRISENHELARYGQLGLRFDRQQTASGEWLVDDPSSSTRPRDVGYLSGLDRISALTIGNEVDTFDAIVSYGFGQYRLLPVEPLTFHDRIVTVPAKAENSIRLVSANVQNLFNGDGRGLGFKKNRGAKNEQNYRTQIKSIVVGLLALDGDLFVLQEVESDGFGEVSTAQDVLEEIHRQRPFSRYRVVEFDRKSLGNSTIQNLIVFNSGLLELVGEPRSVIGDPNWEDRWHRPFVSQRFQLKGGSDRFQVIGAHLKSKGGRCPEDTERSVASEGACLNERLQAIDVLQAWQPADVAEPVFLMGDMNSYPNELPIQKLRSGGWRSVVDLAGQHSYVFNGAPGVLDYILVNPAGESLVEQGGYWNINSGALTSEQLPTRFSNLDPGPFSVFSDHDPVWVDIRLR